MEIQEIISAPPKWLVRWGVTLFFCVLLLMIILAKQIHYPEIIQSRITIYNEGSSEPVTTNCDATIVSVLVNDGQSVSKGQPLVIIENEQHIILPILSPKSGRIIKIGLLNQNLYAPKGQELFYINAIPLHFYGSMALTPNMLNKIKQGQNVIIKIDGYPFEKYGVVHGKIGIVGTTPYSNGTFVSKVNLTYSFSKKIILKNGLIGRAEILYNNNSILDKIIAGIKRTFYR